MGSYWHWVVTANQSQSTPFLPPTNAICRQPTPPALTHFPLGSTNNSGDYRTAEDTHETAIRLDRCALLLMVVLMVMAMVVVMVMAKDVTIIQILGGLPLKTYWKVVVITEAILQVFVFPVHLQVV